MNFNAREQQSRQFIGSEDLLYQAFLLNVVPGELVTSVWQDISLLFAFSSKRDMPYRSTSDGPCLEALTKV
jgi:hypothetical protein